MKPIFELNKLSYVAPDSGRFLVDDVSLSITAGTLTMIIGPNGGGKSTLLKMMTGLLKPSSGSIAIDGKPLSKTDKRLAYVPQHFRISRTVPLTVQDFLRLGSYSKSNMATEDTIHKALHQWGVCHTQHRELVALSGGERQRVLMVRALLTEPDILLMDEPAQGLDILALNDFYERLESLPKKMTRVIVSHDLQWVMKTANHVICLQHHVCCSGAPQDLPHTSHPLLAAYEHRHDHTHTDSCSHA